MAKGLNNLFKRIYTNGHLVCEKVSDITSHQVDANKPLSYYPTPVRMAVTEKTKDNKEVKKTELCTQLVGMQICAALMENSSESPQRVKNGGLEEWLKWESTFLASTEP
jgi:hypothetical protein